MQYLKFEPRHVNDILVVLVLENDEPIYLIHTRHYRDIGTAYNTLAQPCYLPFSTFGVLYAYDSCRR